MAELAATNPNARGARFSEGFVGAAVDKSRGLGRKPPKACSGTARVTRSADATPYSKARCPPQKLNNLICGYGGIGRRARFRY